MVPPAAPPPTRKGRKLLVASIGVATMAYVGANCGGSENVVANLLAPPVDASKDTANPVKDAAPDLVDDFPVANLVAPPVDARAIDVVEDFPVANLVAPPVDAKVFDVVEDFPIANLVPPQGGMQQ